MTTPYTTPYSMIKLNYINSKKELEFWTNKHKEYAISYLRDKAEQANEVKLTLVFGENQIKNKAQVQVWGEQGILLEYFVDIGSPKEWENFTDGFEEEWKTIYNKRKTAISVRKALKGEFI